jgi:hypothetical protein
LRVFPAGGARPDLDLGLPPGSEAGSLRTVAWSHTGLGASGRPSQFSSLRVFGEPGQAAPGDLDPRAPFTASLGGGVSCLMPLVLYSDRAGTLPHAVAARENGAAAMREDSAAAAPAAAGGDERAPKGGRGPAAVDEGVETSAPGGLAGAAATATVLSPDDRNARLAIVMLAWNVVEHFHPRLAPGDPRWLMALPRALREAAAGSGYESLAATLRKMLAATGDGQATVVGPGDAGRYRLPLRWEWVEGQLVIAEAGAGAAGAHAGDSVERLGGRDAGPVLVAAEAEVPASTDAWRRWRALNRLAAGDPGTALRLTLRGLAAPAEIESTGSGTGGGFSNSVGGSSGNGSSGSSGGTDGGTGGSGSSGGSSGTGDGTGSSGSSGGGSGIGAGTGNSGSTGGTGGTSSNSGAGGSGGTGSGIGTGGGGTRGNAAGPAAAREVEVQYSVPPGAQETAAAGDAVREAGPGVLVVDLGRLSEGDLDAALPRLAQARGIVFDLRGAVRATDRLLVHLIAEPVETRREQVPHWSRPDRQAPRYTPLQAALAPQAPHVGARLAFVAAARDVGAAESFLATVAAYHLGAIVGAPTGGASGSVDSAALPGGFTLVWTATLPASGSPPPGAPVEPTAPAAPTRRGLAAGRDEVLEKALALVSPAAATGAGAAAH